MADKTRRDQLATVFEGSNCRTYAKAVRTASSNNISAGLLFWAVYLFILGCLFGAF